MNQNEKQHIVELLCTSEPENIALAEALCDSQKFPLETILREFGYWDMGIKRAESFMEQELSCYGLGLKELPDLLPAALVGLDCSNNLLIKLPKLPFNLKYLWARANQLTALPALPANLKDLLVHNNNLTALPNLPNTLDFLYFHNNKINELPKLPNSLRELNCCDNLISVLRDLPDTLHFLSFVNNKVADFPKLPPNLRELYCKNNVFSIPPDKIKALAPKNCYIVCDTLEEIAAKKLIWTEAENTRLLTLRDKRGLSYNEMQPYFINRTVEQIVLQYRKLKQ